MRQHVLDKELRQHEKSLFFGTLVLAFFPAALAKPPSELCGHMYIVDMLLLGSARKWHVGEVVNS